MARLGVEFNYSWSKFARRFKLF